MSRFPLRFPVAVALLVLGFLVLGAQSVGLVVGAEPQANAEALQRVMAVQHKHNPQVLTLKGVIGTATGLNAQGQWAVKVYAKQAGVAGIPQTMDGVPVDVEVTGEFLAMKPPASTKIDPTSYFSRPVPIGVSTGNAQECAAGTIGCRVKDLQNNVYALSNNHVYARENGGDLGDTVVQPGLYDTRCLYDTKYNLGTLSRFAAISFDGSPNTIDAAIALCPPGTLGKATPSNGYGTPKSIIGSAYVGQAVQKYGRTTSLTKGTVNGINATLNVGYTAGTAKFVSQIVVTSRKAFIRSGDSGSLLVANDNTPVGLLFAGNSSGTYAVANDIHLVLTGLGVVIDGE